MRRARREMVGMRMMNLIIEGMILLNVIGVTGVINAYVLRNSIYIRIQLQIQLLHEDYAY